MRERGRVAIGRARRPPTRAASRWPGVDLVEVAQGVHAHTRCRPRRPARAPRRRRLTCGVETLAEPRLSARLPFWRKRDRRASDAHRAPPAPSSPRASPSSCSPRVTARRATARRWPRRQTRAVPLSDAQTRGKARPRLLWKTAADPMASESRTAWPVAGRASG